MVFNITESSGESEGDRIQNTMAFVIFIKETMTTMRRGVRCKKHQ